MFTDSIFQQNLNNDRKYKSYNNLNIKFNNIFHYFSGKLIEGVREHIILFAGFPIKI